MLTFIYKIKILRNDEFKVNLISNLEFKESSFKLNEMKLNLHDSSLLNMHFVPMF